MRAAQWHRCGFVIALGVAALSACDALDSPPDAGELPQDSITADGPSHALPTAPADAPGSMAAAGSGPLPASPVQAPPPSDAAAPTSVLAPGSSLPACPLFQHRDLCEFSVHLALEMAADAEEDFGGGTELVAIDGQALLARGGDGVYQVVDIPVQGDSGPTSHPLPAEREAIDLITVGRATFVVACAADDCTLFRLDGALIELPGSTLPSGFEPSALVHGPGLHIDSEGRNLPCALGHGIACFTGGSWDVSLEGETLVSATLQDPAVAITVDGRALVQDRASGAFRHEPALDGSALRWVDPFRGGAGMLVEPSVWAEVDDSGQVTRCELGEPFELLRAYSFESRMFGITASHNLVHFFSNEGGIWCDEQPVGDAPIIDLTVAGCGIISNPRVLTAHVLMGTGFCAID